MPIIYSIHNENKKCDEKQNTKLIKLIIQLKEVGKNNNDSYETIQKEILDRIISNPGEVNCPNVDNINLTPLILAVDYPLQDPSIVKSIIATNFITDDDRTTALKLAIENLQAENANIELDINHNIATIIQEIINMLEPSQGGSKKKKTKKKKSKRRKSIKKRRL